MPQVRIVYDPQIVRMLQRIGLQVDTLRRASRVEPTPDLPEASQERLRSAGRLQGDLVVLQDGTTRPAALTWWADLSPVEGPILGPFDDNKTAIAAEIAWLRDHGVPVAGEPQ